MFTAKLVKTKSKIRVMVRHNGVTHEFRTLKTALDWIERIKEVEADF